MEERLALMAVPSEAPAEGRGPQEQGVVEAAARGSSAAEATSEEGGDDWIWGVAED